MAVGDEFFPFVRCVVNGGTGNGLSNRIGYFSDPGLDPVGVGTVDYDGDYWYFDTNWYLVFPGNIGAMGADPFCFEWSMDTWTSVSGTQVLLHIPAGDTSPELKVYLEGGTVKILSNGSPHLTGFNPTGGGGPYRMALKRDGSDNMRLFVEGIGQGTAFSDTVNYDCFNDVFFGADETGADLLEAAIASWRFTHLTSRAAGDYSPPTNPLPEFYMELIGPVLDEDGNPADFDVIALDSGNNVILQQFSHYPALGSYALQVKTEEEVTVLVRHSSVYGDPTVYNHRVIRVKPPAVTP